MTEIPNPFWLQEISLLLHKELIKPSFLQAFSPGAPHPSAAQHASCLFKSWFLVPLSSATWSLRSAMKHSYPLSEGSLLPFIRVWNSQGQELHISMSTTVLWLVRSMLLLIIGFSLYLFVPSLNICWASTKGWESLSGCAHSLADAQCFPTNTFCAWRQLPGPLLLTQQ